MSTPPHRIRFQVAGEAASASSSPSTSSTRSLSSLSSRPQKQKQEPTFTLHRLLQTSQEPVAEKIASYILWDVRENPLEAAQYVEQLGKRLSAETLNEFATDPPMPYLKVVCHFPQPWELVVWAGKIRAKHLGAAGTRSTVPQYPSAAPTNLHAHARSSSTSLPRPRLAVIPPPKPTMRSVPLPVSTPPPFAVPLNVVNVPMPAPQQVHTQQQMQQSRETGITIADLLSAIHQHLHAHTIHTTELESLPDKQRRRVEDAFDRRSKLSPSSETTAGLPLASATSSTFTTAFSPVSVTPSTSSVMSSVTASTSATSPGTPIVGMKMVDKLLKHTWFAGLTVDEEKETVSLTLKIPTAN